jgi:hypothetical protein
MTTFAKFSGLHTSHNYVSSVPEGALAVANNVMISERDVIEPRRGQYSLAYTFGAGSDRAKALFSYGSTLLVQYATSIAKDTGSAFSAYSGTFTPVDDTLCRMRGVEAAQNLYVNTATGVKVLDSAAGAFSSAGVPQCLDVYEVGMVTSASGFLAADRAVAYRAVVGQQDAHSQMRFGAPSQRTVVTNNASYTSNLGGVAAGSVARSSNIVTVYIQGTRFPSLLSAGDTVTMNTTEANFPSGVKTVLGSDEIAQYFYYSEAGIDASSVGAHTFTVPTRSVNVAVGIPNGASTSDIIQLFRSETAPAASIDPGDELYQVAEVNPPAAVTVSAGGAVYSALPSTLTVTSNAHPYVVGQTVECSGDASVTAGCFVISATTVNTFTYYDGTAVGNNVATITYTPRTVVIEDNTPDSALGDPLYTNPNTGDGLEASRYEPPMSKDMVHGGGRLWWLNTTQKHRLEIQMLGVGSPDGVQNNDWIQFTVSGTEYRYSATASSTFMSPTQRVFPAVTNYGSPGLNTEQAALALVRCINQDLTSCPFYAVYGSSANDAPGKVLIVEKGIGGAAISVQASRPDSWFPIIPGDNVTTQASDNSADPAGIAWSDSDQPEAFLLGNTLRVDAKSDPIMRGVWLRDALFVFKQAGGVHMVPNQLPFRSKEVDPTCRLLAPDTVVKLNNQIFALTDQGLVSVTEAGVDIIGWPLDYDVRALLNTARSAITRVPFAVAYETERQLWLWLPAAGADTYCSQAYVYNHATRTFVRATRDRTCGLVMPGTDIMWLGHGTSNTLARERKSFDSTDYADEALSVTINSDNGDGTMTLASATGVAVGDALYRGGNESTITAVNGNIVTLTSAALAAAIGAGAATVYKAYTCEVEPVPQAVGEPGVSKTVSRAVYSFKNAEFDLAKATVWTDEASTQAEYTLPAASSASRPLNKYVSLGTSGSFIAPGFKITEARAKWRLMAISTDIDAQSARGV